MGIASEDENIKFRLANMGQRFTLFAVGIATLAFGFAVVGNFYGAALAESDLSSLLRFVAQVATVFVSLAIFFIHWLPPRQYRTVQSVFLASAFLAIGFLSFAHIITCSMTSAIFESETPVGSFFHMMIGVTISTALFISAFIPRQLVISKRGSYIVLLGFILFVGVVAVAAIEFGSYFPSLCPHDANANPLRLVIEVGAVVVLLFAMAKYYALATKTKEMMFQYLTVATILSAYSHAAFSFHQNPYDLFSVTSTAMTIASLVFVFFALFGTSISEPYKKLVTAQEQAERRRKEAEAATVKAQTYLDFLSHDVANMISPIMGRAEMISKSSDASAGQKEEALKIIDQTHRVSSLIVNLRRLSSAERIDLKKLEPVDLRELLPYLKKTRIEEGLGKGLVMTIHLPEDEQVRVLGGSAAEEIITDIFDNAIQHGGESLTDIEVSVRESPRGMHGRSWDIEILDNGPGIPEHTKAALKLTSSNSESRYTRGVASSLSIMSLIAEALGGRIAVEDRVPNDPAKGTRVVITLPKGA